MARDNSIDLALRRYSLADRRQMLADAIVVADRLGADGVTAEESLGIIPSEIPAAHRCWRLPALTFALDLTDDEETPDWLKEWCAAEENGWTER